MPWPRDPPEAIADRATPPRAEQAVVVDAGGTRLSGTLNLPDGALGIVLFAHGSGSSRFSARNRYVAGVLNRAGIATLLFDLLTEREGGDRRRVFDIPLLAARLRGAHAWLGRDATLGALAVGYFGASTGAAAALVAAAEPEARVAAVVSRGGRPDLAGEALARVTAPTLCIVGGDDVEVLALNREALRRLAGPGRLVVVPGATHLFAEPGALPHVARLAELWFGRHFRHGAARPAGARSGGA